MSDQSKIIAKIKALLAKAASTNALARAAATGIGLHRQATGGGQLKLGGR